MARGAAVEAALGDVGVGVVTSSVGVVGVAEVLEDDDGVAVGGVLGRLPSGSAVGVGVLGGESHATMRLNAFIASSSSSIAASTSAKGSPSSSNSDIVHHGGKGRGGGRLSRYTVLFPAN